MGEKQCSIIKLSDVCRECGKPLTEEELVVADLGFLLCAPDQLDEYLSYISRCGKADLAVVMNDRLPGQVQKAIEGKSVDEIVFVTAVIVGPGALAALERVASKKDKDLEDVILRVLNAEIEVLSESGQPVA